jgi:hypothetical protein
MTKYENRVAFIQSEQVFEVERDDEGLSTVKDYLKIKPKQFLESKDEKEIFKFIHNHAKNNNIRRFVCHIDSGVLEKLMDRMVEKKKDSSSVRSLLNKCTFVATYSNANATREKNKATGSMFYFSLSPLDTVLKNVPGTKFDSKEKEILLCISDSVSTSPYFRQVDNNFIDSANTNVKRVKISELNLDVVNEFSKTGYIIVASLDTFAEYTKFANILKDNACTFRKQILYIENTQPDASVTLPSFSSIQTCSSGVCINGTGYVGLSSLLAYEVCAAALTVCWGSWGKFKEAGVLSLK